MLDVIFWLAVNVRTLSAVLFVPEPVMSMTTWALAISEEDHSSPCDTCTVIAPLFFMLVWLQISMVCVIHMCAGCHRLGLAHLINLDFHLRFENTLIRPSPSLLV